MFQKIPLWIKIVVVLLVLITAGVLYWLGYLDALIALYDIDALVTVVDSMGPYAYVGFLAAYTLGGIIIFPGSILAVSGGVLFGPIVGTAMVLLGAWLSAVTNFLLSRYVFREPITKRLEHLALYKKINGHSSTYGLEFLMVIRTSPGLPFSVKNYLCGITKMHTGEYMVGSIFMLIPGAIMYAYTAGSVAHDGLNWGVAVAIAVSYAFLGVLYLVYKKWGRVVNH